MSRDDLMDFPVLVPPPAEQTAIAAFLDRETAKIDALVAEQERLIALLKEKRQAVISHAVTKGLNAEAPMKDSGIEWLGEIPAHWQVVQLRRIVMRIEQGWSPECESRPAEEGEWGVLKAGCVNRGLFREIENKALPISLEPIEDLEVQAGDLLISRANGNPDLVGSCAFIKETRPYLMLSDKIFRVSTRPNSDPRWFAHVFSSTGVRLQIRNAISGADGLANNLPQSALKGFLAPLPPFEEQAEISAYIDTHAAWSDILIDEAQSAITLLQERRAALISATVTGKIDVRGEAIESNVVPFKSAAPSAGVPALRAVVGAYAIRELGPMGRMAVMKAGFLAEAHVGFSDLNGRYERFAAGPYDRTLLEAMEHGALELCGIVTREPRSAGEAVTYGIPSTATAAPEEALRALVGEDAAARFRRMLSLLKGIGRQGVEAVATIYAVWNDLLADRQATDDEAICRGVLIDWHDEKAKKFNQGDLEHWLAWMRRHEFVPDGSAPRTDNQPKLF